jgi:hypothetical protein
MSYPTLVPNRYPTARLVDKLRIVILKQILEEKLGFKATLENIASEPRDSSLLTGRDS